MRNFFYLSPSRDGWQNLAMDEWFLDHLGPEDLLLYCYINDNAVIIGKNQNPWRECDLQAMDRDGVSWSGGSPAAVRYSTTPET